MSEQMTYSGDDHLADTTRQTQRSAMIIEKVSKNQILLPQAVVEGLRGKTRFRVSVEGATLILSAFEGKYCPAADVFDSVVEEFDRVYGPPDCGQLERVVKLTSKKRITLPEAFKSHYEGIDQFEFTMKGTEILLRPIRDK